MRNRRGWLKAPDRSLEAARLLVAANLFSGPGAACAAHDVTRPVLMVWPRSRQPEHGGVVGLHLHAIRIPAFTEYAVDTRKIVAGHVEQQMMLEVIVDVVRRNEQPFEEIRMRGAGVAQGTLESGTTACSAMLRMRVMTICQVSSGNSHSSG